MPPGRDDLVTALSLAMSGASIEAFDFLGPVTQRVKTVAVEANLEEESPEFALRQVRSLAEANGLAFQQLDDEALASIRGERGALFVDVLDPRFWLVHTMAHADFLHSLVSAVLWKSRDLDWCWLPRHLIEDFRNAGDVEWFKTDFQSDQLSPARGQRARRFRVQLEGDDAYQLLQVIRAQEHYGHAAALTALAVEFSDPAVGGIVEAADYKGRFVGTGSSFELHVGLVSRIVGAYARYVRRIETDFALEWKPQDDGGFTLDGDVVRIPFGKPVQEFDAFLSGLFSCRDPFRLWGVPRQVSDRFASVQAVDLHVGSLMPMDVSTEGLRIYLGVESCGNSVARLLANLQHRYDATIQMTLSV